MEHIDLFGSCERYDVNLLNVSNEIIDELVKAGVSEPGETYICMTKSLIDKFDIPSDAIDFDSYEVDQDMLESELEHFLGNYPHYLVIAIHCKWNGASGWMFTNSRIKTVSRDYDISLIIEENGQDAIKCRESSHDVPMGSTTYIVGLSNDDFDKLEDAELDELIKYAESRF